MILWVSCVCKVCKRIPRDLRANWNTAVRRGNAATKKLFEKEEIDREWYSWVFAPHSAILLCGLTRLLAGRSCDDLTL